jgi:hypothetical protein
MEQISACGKKIAAGCYFILLYFSTLVDALQHLSYKNWRPATTTYHILATRYTSGAESEDFSHCWRLSAQVHGICGGRYIDLTKLIL